jgi:hypothetical protein
VSDVDASQLCLELPEMWRMRDPYRQRPGSCKHRDHGTDPMPGCVTCAERLNDAVKLSARIALRLKHGVGADVTLIEAEAS